MFTMDYILFLTYYRFGIKNSSSSVYKINKIVTHRTYLIICIYKLFIYT
jgi:hypothetical protein